MHNLDEEDINEVYPILNTLLMLDLTDEDHYCTFTSVLDSLYWPPLDSIR